MHICVEQLSSNDLGAFTDLINVFGDVFEMEGFDIPDQQYLQRILEGGHLKVFVAKDDDTVVGGLTLYILEQYYSERPLAYIYDLGISTVYQRRGIGRMLIRAVKEYCTTAGFEELFVQADKDDAHALDFYRATRSNEKQVVHFYCTLGNSGEK
jgi:aminoglycoside 3-N-acetyltransferase I